jgi:hypothetical protein
MICTKMVYYSDFMKIRHIILRALLALLLLVSQQMAIAHAVSHLSGTHSESSGKQLPADQFCDQCLSAAQLDSGATSFASLLFVDAGPAPAPAILLGQGFVARTVCAFQSRAPPTA